MKRRLLKGNGQRQFYKHKYMSYLSLLSFSYDLYLSSLLVTFCLPSLLKTASNRFQLKGIVISEAIQVALKIW